MKTEKTITENYIDLHNKKHYSEAELNDMNFIDSIKVDNNQRKKGLIKALIFTTIALFIFFIPLSINGESTILFGYIYGTLKKMIGIAGLWICAFFIAGNAIISFYGKYKASKDSKLYDLYSGDSKAHPFIYLAGAVFMVLFTIDRSFSWFSGPEFIVSPDIGGVVINGVVLATLWVLPLSAIFMPFLLNYGGIDFIGTLMEPLMRPIFRVPGKSSVDAISSFVSSSSVAVLITNNLYKNNVYTKREAIVITTCFSAVSVGFASVVISTAGMGHDFSKIYFLSLFLSFVISIIMCRIPPLKNREDVYYNGKVQTEEDRKTLDTTSESLVNKAVSRAAKKALLSENITKHIKTNIKEAMSVMPKVLSFTVAAGIIGLIIAEYTPVFEWIGMIFLPLLKICGVPSPEIIAPALTVGIAEMFLPVLMIKSHITVMTEAARFFIVVVSMVQIIFFSETASLILATKMPVKARELVIIFFERTLIAIPLVALVMHILY
ncbi:YjiH family protein [Abyssisolibacter fermentans]|uniref:YjiH family protein n=1 Tax=Abyssisolibacter fermentans TaxID=1766203 RepID=UPI000A50E24D|nr:YjiH family protein [Abyssisolibacter fermentans]